LLNSYATTAAVLVNGPEDGLLDWPSIDWRAVEDNVRRLRQRIFTASQTLVVNSFRR
jgi:RNA-directed DNA polymerase